RGVNITKEEFLTIREYTVFEAQQSAKNLKRSGYTYIIIGIAAALMSIFLRNRITIFGLLAAAALFFTGYRLLKKGKENY
ncbi:MAG: hypothetical protein LBQ47_06860, partial [Endomicrobium sp.]|nr:hypothetical protein [Endomicrobium sp.]